MIDIETLSTEKNACIVSIGAATRIKGELVTFYEFADYEEQQKKGGHISWDCLRWWINRPDAKKQLANDPGVALPLRGVLQLLKGWIKELGRENPKFWANSPRFDLAILEHWYKECCIETPWTYKQERCFRTVAALNGGYNGKVAHNAKDDAVNQLLFLEGVLSG